MPRPPEPVPEPPIDADRCWDALGDVIDHLKTRYDFYSQNISRPGRTPGDHLDAECMAQNLLDAAELFRLLAWYHDATKPPRAA